MKYGLLAGLAFTAASHASINLKANEQPLQRQPYANRQRSGYRTAAGRQPGAKTEARSHRLGRLAAGDHFRAL